MPRVSDRLRARQSIERAIPANRGILYIASGTNYRDEAIISARSVKAAWPDVPIAIITDQPLEAGIFDIVQITALQGDNIDKVRNVSRSPFERTILLDTDTYCLQPFPELFDLLERFQLAAALDISRFSERWDPSTGRHVFIQGDGVPECFIELNTGVIAFRNEPDVLQVFDQWLKACLAARGAADPYAQDQPSFRKVIYNSGLRIATLPSEYCFRLHTPDYARTAVKILHGRWSYSNLGSEPGAVLARLGRLINKSLGTRILVHAFGIIAGHGPYCIPLNEQHEQLELVFKEPPPAPPQQAQARAPVRDAADGAPFLSRYGALSRISTSALFLAKRVLRSSRPRRQP